MKELISLVLKLDFQGLFFRPTNNGLIQFFRYAFVGAIASVVDWAVLWALEYVGIYYLLASVFAFFAGLATNFFLSKKLVFNAQQSRVGNVSEFVAYAAIGVVGLLITLGIMYLLTDVLKIYFMFSKIIATVIVLVWNFLARKVLIYRS